MIRGLNPYQGPTENPPFLKLHILSLFIRQTGLKEALQRSPTHQRVRYRSYSQSQFDYSFAKCSCNMENLHFIELSQRYVRKLTIYLRNICCPQNYPRSWFLSRRQAWIVCCSPRTILKNTRQENTIDLVGHGAKNVPLSPYLVKIAQISVRMEPLVSILSFVGTRPNAGDRTI